MTKFSSFSDRSAVDVSSVSAVLGSVSSEELAVMDTSGLVLSVGAPGTGKSSAFMIPSIIESDRQSVIAFDTKGELLRLTGKHRAGISDLYYMNFFGSDVYPENEGEADSSRVYARFNVLSPAFMPLRGLDRDRYIEMVSDILVRKESFTPSDYFPHAAGAAISAGIHLLVTVISESDNPDRWSLLGLEKWKGQEVSLPMLADWFASLASASSSGNLKDDLLFRLQFFRGLVDSSFGSPFVSGFAREGLEKLVNMADRERSSVLGTVSLALMVFRNQGVVDKTSSSDFDAASIRGTVNHETGETRPFTFYLSSDCPAQGALFGRLSSLMIQCLGFIASIYRPGDYVPMADRMMGSLPVLFALDDAEYLENMTGFESCVREARKDSVAYILNYQSYYGMVKKFGVSGAENILSQARYRLWFGSHIASDILDYGFRDQNPIYFCTNSRADFNKTVAEGKVCVFSDLPDPDFLDKAFWFKIPGLSSRVGDSSSRLTKFVPETVFRIRTKLHFLEKSVPTQVD